MDVAIDRESYVTFDRSYVVYISDGDRWMKRKEEALLLNNFYIAGDFVSIGLACIKGCHKDAWWYQQYRQLSKETSQCLDIRPAVKSSGYLETRHSRL